MPNSPDPETGKSANIRMKDQNYTYRLYYIEKNAVTRMAAHSSKRTTSLSAQVNISL